MESGSLKTVEVGGKSDCPRFPQTPALLSWVHNPRRLGIRRRTPSLSLLAPWRGQSEPTNFGYYTIIAALDSVRYL